jgi:hypothetical protein
MALGLSRDTARGGGTGREEERKRRSRKTRERRTKAGGGEKKSEDRRGSHGKYPSCRSFMNAFASGFENGRKGPSRIKIPAPRKNA